MLLQNITDNSFFTWVLLPALIFVSRICDVSIGTLRIIFVSRSKKFLAPLLGFFEISIWLLAISQIMSHLDNAVCFVAYAGGFATGNFIGILIEEKLAIGTLIIRIFLPKGSSELKDKIHQAGFGATSIDAHGRMSDVEIIYTIIKRKKLRQIIEIIENCNADAFYSIEEVRDVNKGYFHETVKARVSYFRPLKKLKEIHYVRPGK